MNIHIFLVFKPTSYVHVYIFARRYETRGRAIALSPVSGRALAKCVLNGATLRKMFVEIFL